MISPSETRDLIIYDIFHKIKYLRFDPERITTIDIGGSLFRCYLNIHFTKSLLFFPKKPPLVGQILCYDIYYIYQE